MKNNGSSNGNDENKVPRRKLRADIKKASVTMTHDEARFLVDAYYINQEARKRSDNQVRAMGEEPHSVVTYCAEQARDIESDCRLALDHYSASKPIGKWSREIVGIGPVISAGLMSHIDIKKAPHVGHIWMFAGLGADQPWEKGKKRPWNAALKTLCWTLGESFVKTQNSDGSFYGPLFVERKAIENRRNDTGEYKDQAAAKLEKYKIGKSTDAYKHYSGGKLPPAHIHARARRWTVKLFLSHWWEQMFVFTYDKDAPPPYPIAIMGHSDYIERPNPVKPKKK